MHQFWSGFRKAENFWCWILLLYHIFQSVLVQSFSINTNINLWWQKPRGAHTSLSPTMKALTKSRVSRILHKSPGRGVLKDENITASLASTCKGPTTCLWRTKKGKEQNLTHLLAWHRAFSALCAACTEPWARGTQSWCSSGSWESSVIQEFYSETFPHFKWVLLTFLNQLHENRDYYLDERCHWLIPSSVETLAFYFQLECF